MSASTPTPAALDAITLPATPRLAAALDALAPLEDVRTWHPDPRSVEFTTDQRMALTEVAYCLRDVLAANARAEADPLLDPASRERRALAAEALCRGSL